MTSILRTLLLLAMAIATAAPITAQGIIRPKTTPRHTTTPAKTKATPRRQAPRDEIAKLIASMVYVEGGTFDMGATAEMQFKAEDNEHPVHRVTLDGYYICRYEVTQALWQHVMGSDPAYYRSANRPVEQVSWRDCQIFIARLNKLSGKTFRLPTEAEWEYAARGGRHSRGYTYSGSNDIDEVGWYNGNSEATHPVGSKRPNELGLYDMTGNVFEFCSGWYGSYSAEPQANPSGAATGQYHPMRGGSYVCQYYDCRISCREDVSDTYIHQHFGLRLASTAM